MIGLLKDIARYKFNRSPDYLIAFVTDRCNLKCYHCFNPNQASDLDAELLIGAINSCNWKNITLTGGETFLYRDLAYVIDSIKSEVSTITIPTNGLITNTIVKALDEIVPMKPQTNFNISVSIDGPMEIHNKIRNNNSSYESALETIRSLGDLKKRKQNISICVNTVISKINIHHLEQTLEALAEEPIDYHDFEIVRNHPGMNLELPEINELKNAVQLVLKNYSSYTGQSSFKNKIKRKIYESIYNEKIKIIASGKSKFLCKAPYIYAVINTNGDVSYCELKPPIGNLKEDSLLNLWNSDTGAKQRSEIRRTRCCCSHGCFLPLNMKLDPKLYTQAIASV